MSVLIVYMINEFENSYILEAINKEEINIQKLFSFNSISIESFLINKNTNTCFVAN